MAIDNVKMEFAKELSNFLGFRIFSGNELFSHPFFNLNRWANSTLLKRNFSNLWVVFHHEKKLM
jgi:hypothetical protein